MMSEAKIFLSYARDDAAHARALSARLAERGLEIWSNELIPVGLEWSSVIRDAISASTIFLVFISRSFQQSSALTLELGAILSARRSRKSAIVIPILLPPATPEDVPEALRELQFIELREDNEDDVAEAIARAVKAASAGSEVSDAQTPRMAWRRPRRWRRLIMRTVSLSVLAISLSLIALLNIPNNATHPDLSGVNLRGSGLDGVKLAGARLARANLENASLRGADLRGAVLAFARLRSANLSNADLRKADLKGADLTKAVLSAAVLSDAALQGAILRGADLSKAKGLTTQQLESACGDEATRLPAGMKVPLCAPVTPPIEGPGNG